jgi:hypothetical protein
MICFYMYLSIAFEPNLGYYYQCGPVTLYFLDVYNVDKALIRFRNQKLFLLKVRFFQVWILYLVIEMLK